ncbi:MAG: hypothetical protein ACLFPL_01875 [Candidatus Nanoarchaeia archaeon]
MTIKKSASKIKRNSFFLSAFVTYARDKINENVNRYIEEEITPRVVRFSEVSILFIVGFVLLLVGVAQFLASLISFLENGLNYIILGVVLLLIAYFLSK